LMRDAPDPDRDFVGAHEYGPGSRSRLAGGRLGLLPLPDGEWIGMPSPKYFRAVATIYAYVITRAVVAGCM